MRDKALGLYRKKTFQAKGTAGVKGLEVKKRLAHLKSMGDFSVTGMDYIGVCNERSER